LAEGFETSREIKSPQLIHKRERRCSEVDTWKRNPTGECRCPIFNEVPSKQYVLT
jgi:hypothetical protein